MSAAVCDVDDCGVLAVGRCKDCGQAFCGTHQGGDQLRRYTDWCLACQDERARRQKASVVAWNQAVENRIRYLLERLDAAGVTQQVHRVVVGHAEVRRGLRKRLEPVYEDRDSVWEIGVFDWDQTESYSQGSRGKHRTGITRGGALVALEGRDIRGCRASRKQILDVLELFVRDTGVDVDPQVLPDNPAYFR